MRRLVLLLLLIVGGAHAETKVEGESVQVIPFTEHGSTQGLAPDGEALGAFLAENLARRLEQVSGGSVTVVNSTTPAKYSLQGDISRTSDGRFLILARLYEDGQLVDHWATDCPNYQNLTWRRDSERSFGTAGDLAWVSAASLASKLLSPVEARLVWLRRGWDDAPLALQMAVDGVPLSGSLRSEQLKTLSLTTAAPARVYLLWVRAVDKGSVRNLLGDETQSLTLRAGQSTTLGPAKLPSEDGLLTVICVRDVDDKKASVKVTLPSVLGERTHGRIQGRDFTKLLSGLEGRAPNSWSWTRIPVRR